MNVSGTVFDISRACVDDGPGLRTVVFLKGCGLDCGWCHNPEGKSFAPIIAYEKSHCIGCGACEKACPHTWIRGNWRDSCEACGKCVSVCPSGARRVVGKSYDVKTLSDELLIDKDFFAGSEGGVTFSGGEPLLQPELLFSCIDKLHENGIHCAVETSGHWSSKIVEEATRKIDLFLLDIKHVNPDKFHAAVGRKNSTLLSNLEQLSQHAKSVEFRLTLIPGFNDSNEDIEEIANWLISLPRKHPLRLQTFHRMAAAKSQIYGVKYPFADTEPILKRRVSVVKKILSLRGISLL